MGSCRLTPATGRPRGVQLVEVLFAAGLSSLILVFVLGILAGSARAQRRAEDLQTATGLARQFLEDARSALQKASDNRQQTDLPSLIQALEQPTDVDMNGTAFHAERRIAVVDEHLVDIIVQVSWPAGSVPVRLATRVRNPQDS